MMRRTLLLMCSIALVAGVACGKYGRPQRVSQPEPTLAVSDDATEQERDEAQKSHKQ